MNLCRCEKGHFYDKEKYATCPHCAGGSASDEKLTEAFTQDFTIPADAARQTPPSVPPVTPAAPPVMNVPPVAPAAPPIMNVPPVVPVNPMPVAGLSANQVTVAMNNGINPDTPTVPLDQYKTEDAPSAVDAADDDHTVGFFDDVFSAASGTAAKPAPTAGVKTPAVQRVNTPCVGWLIALGGEHIGTDFRLKVGKNFIGRSLQMDVALTDDKSVSRERHAIVVYDPKSNFYLVQPGESSSLVYHNNKLVLTPEKLEAYDMITVGDINLLFMPLCSERFNWGELLEELKKKNK